MRGISISSVSTSGESDRILSRATYGSGAVPTISISGSSLEGLGQDLANDRRIVDDQHARFSLFRHSDMSRLPGPFDQVVLHRRRRSAGLR